MFPKMTPTNIMPADGYAGTLIGRAWFPGAEPGPCVVVIREDGVHNISGTVPTVSELLNDPNPLTLIQRAVKNCVYLGSVEDLLANSTPDSHDGLYPYFLSPIDLQAVKACGVTFVKSMLERVIEEKAQGNPAKADDIRALIEKEVGGDVATVKPGSEEAAKLKAALIERDMWSQYLEVGIGPDAEVFTKAQVLSTVGTGAEVGVHPKSEWNNPEPEVVLAVNGKGKIVGAMLGNDVNLRDFEGRSALLLGKAKDNNASCSVGPFIRLFDNSFALEDVKSLTVTVSVEGEDGFLLTDTSSMSDISRDIEDLVAQTINENHAYPDGLVLFTGTQFAPLEDRVEIGMGFTHKIGDIVSISAPALGKLVNRVNHSDKIPLWNYGIADLINNLSHRHLY